MPTPEEAAREIIDQKLTTAGWVVQDFKQLNLGKAPGVVVREFQMASGPADYVLFGGWVSVADEIETEFDQALARSERLRQSILKRAFEGRLV